MAVLKILDSDYKSVFDVQNLIAYILRTSATNSNLTVLNGIYMTDIEGMAQQFSAMKSIWGQSTGRQYYQIILSYKENEIYDENQILSMLQILLSQSTLREHQCIAAVHTDKQTFDAHILINSVNSFTGCKFDFSKIAFWRQQCAILSDYMGVSQSLCKPSNWCKI